LDHVVVKMIVFKVTHVHYLFRYIWAVVPERYGEDEPWFRGQHKHWQLPVTGEVYPKFCWRQSWRDSVSCGVQTTTNYIYT